MMRIWTIATNTLREAVRNKVLYTLLLFTVAFIALGLLLSTLFTLVLVPAVFLLTLDAKQWVAQVAGFTARVDAAAQDSLQPAIEQSRSEQVRPF